MRNPLSPKRRAMKVGFPLLGLLVALAILGPVALLGYSNYAPTYRPQAATTELQRVLQKARTEVIRRGTFIVVETEGGELLVMVEDQVVARFLPQGCGASLQASASLTLNALGRPKGEVDKSFTLTLGNRRRSLTMRASGRIQ
ncbi:MAG: Tfp pilus assembly protein FimT/FimU [Thermus sp.]|uniref:pilus assembly FimT family protein n=1 Tax=Thermus sp. TaxID=275 RepID=UPI00391D1079